MMYFTWTKKAIKYSKIVDKSIYVEKTKISF